MLRGQKGTMSNPISIKLGRLVELTEQAAASSSALQVVKNFGKALALLASFVTLTGEDRAILVDTLAPADLEASAHLVLAAAKLAPSVTPTDSSTEEGDALASSLTAAYASASDGLFEVSAEVQASIDLIPATVAAWSEARPKSSGGSGSRGPRGEVGALGYRLVVTWTDPKGNVTTARDGTGVNSLRSSLLGKSSVKAHFNTADTTATTWAATPERQAFRATMERLAQQVVDGSAEVTESGPYGSLVVTTTGRLNIPASVIEPEATTTDQATDQAGQSVAA